MRNVLVCDVCNQRNAIYSRKRKKQAGRDFVCATCMVACKAVFGDRASDFTRIKYDD